MLCASSQFVRWLLFAWTCAALWISPTRIVHAHAGGEEQHSRFEHHKSICPQGEDEPGRHAHFLIFGREVHIPLPAHEDPAGLATEEPSLVPTAEKQLDVAIVIFTAAQTLFEAAYLQPEISAPHPAVEKRQPGPVASSGRACRLLFSSLTL